MPEKCFNIAVDARPLLHLESGIGRCTYNLLLRLTENDNYNWFFYSDRPLITALSERTNVTLRTGYSKGSISGFMYAQCVFPYWAGLDEIDIFWSPRHHLPLFLSSSIRCFVSVYDLVWCRFPGTMTRLGYLQEKLLMSKSLRKADVILAISNFTKNEITSLYPGQVAKVEVVEGASSFSVDSAIKTNTERYFLFVGTIEPRKNIERLLLAYSIYISTAENIVPLKIVGAIGWGDISVKKHIDEYELGKYVECEGCVADDELEMLYKNAYALLMPSLYEGFGLPLVEAMNFGVPAIVSAGGALEEVGRDAVVHVDPLSVDSIAEKIRLIANNYSLREELSRAAIIQSQMYQWDKSADKILKIIAVGEDCK